MNEAKQLAAKGLAALGGHERAAHMAATGDGTTREAFYQNSAHVDRRIGVNIKEAPKPEPIFPDFKGATNATQRLTRKREQTRESQSIENEHQQRVHAHARDLAFGPKNQAGDVNRRE